MKIITTEVKELDPIKTVSVSHVGDYMLIYKAFDKVFSWAETNNLWTGSPKMMGVYQDDLNKTPIQELRSKACLEDQKGTQLDEGMEHYTISGGKYFVCKVEVMFPEYPSAWQKAYSLFNEKSYEYDSRDHYELYVSCAGDPRDEATLWEADLCIPMK